jgi:Uma2 family endonuclease
MGTRTLMTAAEFGLLEILETEDYELVDGELIPLPTGTPEHADIRGVLEHKVRTYFETNPIGRPFAEIDCRITDSTVRRPDLCIFVGEHAKLVDRKKIPVAFPPDIAVEVISPSESVMKSNRKIRDYLGAGSQEVWILDHENRELFIHTKTGIRLLLEDHAIESPLLPGFAVTLGELLV